MTVQFQRVAAIVMLIALVGISTLMLRNAYLSQTSTHALPTSADPEPPEVLACPWTGAVTGVIDGDTIDVDHDGTPCRVRIHGVDCPEAGQPFAEEAQELTASLVAGRDVTVTPIERDRLGRTVADVTFSDGDTVRHLNRELLQAGLAWWYRAECPDVHDLESLEAQAREEGRGLWAKPGSLPPWEYREMTWRAGTPETPGDDPATPPH